MPRRLGPNITIDGRSLPRLQTVYESDVHNALLGLMMFETGKALIEYIWNTPRRLRIVPWHSFAQNAAAVPTNWRGSQRRGQPVRDGTGRHRPAWGHGTGRGSNSIVRYTPYLFPVGLLPRWDRIAMRRWQQRLNIRPVAAGDDTEEVLLHELVHAVEDMRGLGDSTPLGHQFDTVGEFHAILVANLLGRERNRPARLNHHGNQSASSPTALFPDEDEFWRHLETFRARHPGFAAALARVNVEDNPFVGRAAYRLAHEPWPSGLPPF